MTRILVDLVRAHGGHQLVDTLLADAGCPHGVQYLEQEENWIALDIAVSLLEAGGRLTDDPGFARRVGAQAVRRLAGSPVATLLRSLGSPEAVLAQITTTAGKFSTVTDLEAIESGPGRAVVHARARSGHRRALALCEWAQGLLSTPTELFGLGSSQVTELACQAHGADQCIYEITWDAALASQASDPEQRVTALEAQLVAMSERLQGAYATARDLVSLDDVGTVLDRIVERAAREVRAPQYVLAIRPGPLGPLQVFTHGLDHTAAVGLAQDALAPEPSLPDSLICVEVASSRRDYGRLIARQSPGLKFFDQERLALGLYAKHAAAVLDMAVALRDASRRNDVVSALLELAHDLGQAGTTTEIAGRLAPALPRVIDCDRAAVWLWDQDEDALRSIESWGYDGAHADVHSRAVLEVATSPVLRAALTSRAPLLIEPDSEDPQLRQLLRDTGSARVAAAPIIHREELLGAVTVSVVERPERLDETLELTERLIGVASLAGPALQNGRLVDELAFKATHDALTGLLNRIGFGLLFDRTVAEARNPEHPVGLLFVDLNGFKGINDLHGHDAGDELLRQVAERLGHVVRGTDTVARLGGDEFAIILGDVDAVAEVHAVAGRIREAFRPPFRVTDAAPAIPITASVGCAIWPDQGQTAESLLRYADVAMYREKGRIPRLQPAHLDPESPTCSQ